MRLLKHNLETCGAAAKVQICCFQLQPAFSLMIPVPGLRKFCHTKGNAPAELKGKLKTLSGFAIGRCPTKMSGGQSFRRPVSWVY